MRGRGDVCNIGGEEESLYQMPVGKEKNEGRELLFLASRIPLRRHSHSFTHFVVFLHFFLEIETFDSDDEVYVTLSQVTSF